MSSDASRLGFYLLLAPILLWLVVLIILPHVGLFVVSISEKIGPREYEIGMGNYAAFFQEPLFWRTFARTAIMSILATALTLILGFPIAYYIAKLTQGRTKTTLFLMCMIPFWVSELVRTFGWMILLRETGVFSSFYRAILDFILVNQLGSFFVLDNLKGLLDRHATGTLFPRVHIGEHIL